MCFIKELITAYPILSIANKIDLWGIVASASVGVIALIISIATLRQNHKIIREANRATIIPSYETYNVAKPSTYFKIKNYGNIGAVIESFHCSAIDQDYFLQHQFSRIEGTFLAPGQSNLYYFCADQIKDEVVNFRIKYRSTDGRKITENFSVKINLRCIYEKRNEERTISFTLQEIALQNLRK